MVKQLVKPTVVQAPLQKPLAGAVYKRQRKQLPALSRGTELPQHANGHSSSFRGETTARETQDRSTRLAATKSSHKSVCNRLHNPTQRANCTSSRVAPQPLQHTALPSSQNPQKTQDAQTQPSSTWGLAHEAQYFADLDAEELIQDGQEAAAAPEPGQPAATGQSQEAATSQTEGSMQPDKQKGVGSKRSSHMQTPDAIALAKYHPDLQAEYVRYVRCMGSSQSALTPMLLEDFCRLVGKEARGLPVFNT